MNNQITFPTFSALRCLMMPYIQGRPESVPSKYGFNYADILSSLYFKQGEIGFLTIDESMAKAGIPHRGARAKHSRALHTEAGRHPDKVYAWGGGGWGASHRVTLDRNTKIILSNNLDNSCAIWNAEQEETSL